MSVSMWYISHFERLRKIEIASVSVGLQPFISHRFSYPGPRAAAIRWKNKMLLPGLWSAPGYMGFAGLGGTQSRAAALSYQEESAEAGWSIACGGYLDGAVGQSREALEGLYFPAGFGIPGGPSGQARLRGLWRKPCFLTLAFSSFC